MVLGLWLTTREICMRSVGQKWSNSHSTLKVGEGHRVLVQIAPAVDELALLLGRRQQLGVHSRSSSHLISYSFSKSWASWICSSVVWVSSFAYRSAIPSWLEAVGNRHAFQFVPVGCSLPSWVLLCSFSVPLYVHLFFLTALLTFGNFTYTMRCRGHSLLQTLSPLLIFA